MVERKMLFNILKFDCIVIYEKHNEIQWSVSSMRSTEILFSCFRELLNVENLLTENFIQLMK